MSEMIGWMKSIFCFTVVLSVIYQLLPQNVYLKYIRVFGGIIMAILVMQPVLKLINEEISLEETMEVESRELELESAKQEIEAMMRYKETFYLEKLEEEYGSEVLEELEEWDQYKGNEEESMADSFAGGASSAGNRNSYREEGN